VSTSTSSANPPLARISVLSPPGSVSASVPSLVPSIAVGTGAGSATASTASPVRPRSVPAGSATTSTASPIPAISVSVLPAVATGAGIAPYFGAPRFVGVGETILYLRDSMTSLVLRSSDVSPDLDVGWTSLARREAEDVGSTRQTRTALSRSL